jgi:hypothetical protein
VRTLVVVGALTVAAFIAGIAYLRHDSADQPAATMQSAAGSAASAEPSVPVAGAPQASVSGSAPSEPRHTDSKQTPPDPRLAALSVSPDNGSIEFVRGSDGKVITEIDREPSSPGFGKPAREYMYSGDKVIGLTAYRYLPDHVEIERTSVSYKPDGSVDRYEASTSYEPGKKK